MELFAIEYNNGEDYEYYEQDTVGVFDSREKTVEVLEAAGFKLDEEDESGNFFFREHETVKDKCFAHTDYVNIYELELNKLKENKINVFGHHYKN